MTSFRFTGKIVFGCIVATIGLLFLGTLGWIWLARDKDQSSSTPRELLRPASTETACYPVVIRQPDGQLLVDSGKVNPRGEPILISCATCHDTRAPQVATNHPSQLDEFHQGLRYAHGDLTCLSCHQAEDYDMLRKSDGTSIKINDSINLCAQCHGPQYRDYRNGSHGGMTGHWDLTRGGRQRNTCIDCHDPHHPAYPLVTPVFPPKPVKGETIKNHE